MISPHFDTLKERIRERVQEYDRGHCLNCNAQLTQADVENDRCCTNCGSNMDEEDGDLNGRELGYDD